MLQAEYILDLHKQLTLLGDGSRKDLNGSIAEDSISSTTPADKVRSLLFLIIKISSDNMDLYAVS